MKFKTLSEYCEGLKDGPNTVLDMFKGAPKHLRIMNEVLGFKYDGVLIPGGRASAKSMLIATIAALFAKNGNADIVYLVKNIGLVRCAMESVLHALDKLGESDNQKNWNISYSTNSIVYGENGRKLRYIKFASLDKEPRGEYWYAGASYKLIIMDDISGMTRDMNLLLDKILYHARTRRHFIATANFATQEEVVEELQFFKKVYKPLTVYDIPLKWIGKGFLAQNKDYEKYVAARDGKPCGKMVFDAIVKGIPYDEWEYKTELMKHLRENDPQRYYEIMDKERKPNPEAYRW